jgi:uncharacterized protein (UPF0276 family)
MTHPTAGLGFKPEHFADAMRCSAAGMWYEIHAENYMVAGGTRLSLLDALRDQHPVSVHGVGLSLASAEEPDHQHLLRLKQVVDRSEAFVVSEHLAWNKWQGTHVPDLLPFPRTTEALQLIERNIDIAQNTLQRKLLIENPSLYLSLDTHEWSETDFLTELVNRTGCGLLVDVNNIYVSTQNIGGDAYDYLDQLPANAIGEIHIAGHVSETHRDTTLLIDTHGAAICEAVWNLYQYLIRRIGARPTLIERDNEIPGFSELLVERNRAAQLLSMLKIQEHADACVS